MRGFNNVFLLVILCVCITCVHVQADQRPNILLIFSDDQGYNDVSCYGSEIPTPSIDSIAQEGIRFTSWYVAAAVCTPSRYALLTGQYPNRSHDKMLGALMTVDPKHEDKGIRPHETTIAAVLKKHGYRTALIGKWHLGHGDTKFFPTRHGFDYFYGHAGGCIDFFKLTYGYKPNWYRGEKLIQEKGYATDLLTDDAVKYIEAQKQGQPFFLYLPYNAPHYGKGWDPKRKKLLNILQAKEEDIARFKHIENKSRRTFAAMVACMDDGVGRVLDALKKKKLDSNTIVIFMTDNGGPLHYGANNDPLRGQKGSFYEGGVRVPCVMRWPEKVKPGTVTNQPGSALDIFPMLCRIAGVDTSKFKLDGINILPTLLEGKKIPRSLFWQAGERKAYRHGPWKFVRDRDKAERLFNLEKDLSEKNDLAKRHPEKLAELKAAHDTISAEFTK